MNKAIYWTAFICMLIQNVSAQCPALVPLSIQATVIHESRCKASGKAVVYMRGGVAPYTYSIVAGPFIPPIQSSNVFESLSAGTYTMKVTDQCNKSITRTFEVKGTYEIPILASKMFSPSCSRNDGKLEIEVINKNSRAPFTYALVSPSPKVITSQASPIFDGLAPGTYTYRVTDSCGNYQSRTVTLLQEIKDSLVISIGNLKYISCGTYAVPYRIQTKGRDSSYSISLTYAGNIKTHQVSSIDNVIRDTFYFSHKHKVGLEDLYTISLKDACGRTISSSKDFRVLDLEALNFSQDDCSRQFTYNFDYKKDNGQLRCDSTFYALFAPDGRLLAKQKNNAEFNGYPAGIGYKIIREDCCGKDSLVFNWLEQLPLKINSFFLGKLSSCKQGTTNIALKTNNPIKANVIIVSGPASVQFMDGTEHKYVYPDTLKDLMLGNTGYTLINYFTAGTYKIMVVDKCDQKDSALVIIKPTDLRKATFTADYIKGCENANIITWTANTNFLGGLVDINPISNYSKTIGSYTAKDSVVNLKSGAYTVNYRLKDAHPINAYLAGMESLACDVIQKPISIANYIQPAFKSPIVTVCGNNLHVTLLPDSSRGMAPYLYQIASKPYSTVLKPDNTFSNLVKGTYTFLMSDACGNSYSQNTSIDTLVFPTLNASGKNCVGDRVTLSVALYPFYTYTWQHPSGKKTQSNSLVINSLTSADTGVYKITVTPNIFGCTKSRTQSIKVNFCEVLPLEFLDFVATQKGTSVLLTWQIAHESPSDYFEVERSSNGFDYESITQLNGSQLMDYAYTDKSIEKGRYYYRIKLVHSDGTYTYSNSIGVNSSSSDEISIFPNPMKDVLQLRWPEYSESDVDISIVNMAGQVQWKGSAGDTESLEISLGFLQPGVYLIKFYKEGEVVVKKIVKE